MKRVLILLTMMTALAANAQIAKIVIPAGTPEDLADQAITNEADGQKRLTMLQDFVVKFADNPQAVAYGNWKIAQQYLNQGDSTRALEFADKALAVQPNNLDILVFACQVAQQANDRAKVMDYAAKGGTAFNGVATQPKPAEMSAENFAQNVKQDQESVRPSYEFLEQSAVNAMAQEKDDSVRMGYLERYAAAFPASRFQEQISQLIVYTLGNLKDPVRMAAFGDKALANNPNNLSMLVLLASAMAENPDVAYAPRAEGYARKALEVAKGETGLDVQKVRTLTGVAHSALGYALVRQQKYLPAITELKAAIPDVKDNANAYGAVLYRLGYAYALTGKLTDAKAALTEAGGMHTDFQAAARELLVKVDSELAKRKR
jgi:tetratricopeptide (TPR) repeat protein